MAGPLHAIALLGLLAVTAFSCVRFHRKPQTMRVVWAVVAAAITGLVTMLLSVHSCELGQPLTQWLLPALCLGAVLTFVGPTAIRWGLTALLLASGAALSMHFASEVHGDNFVGTASPGDHSGIDRVESEWHTPLSGLYRRYSLSLPPQPRGFSGTPE